MEIFIVGFILSAVFCIIIVALGAVGRIGKPKIDHVRLLDAISIVETNNDDSATGDGNAVGRFQLRKKYVDDVNQILVKEGVEESFTYDDRKDNGKSRLMIATYWMRYAKQPFCGFLHIEDFVAIHRAGPKGHKKLRKDEQLKEYVAKVKKQYEELVGKME